MKNEISKMLEALYSVLNDNFFNGYLPMAVFDIGDYKINGLTSFDRISISGTNNDIKQYSFLIKIPINEYQASKPELAACLLHNMIHIKSYLNPDENKLKGGSFKKCESRGGYYHNKKFANEASKIGLEIKKDKLCGYVTTCGATLLNKLNSIPEYQEIKYIHLLSYKNKNTLYKQSTVKWECPICNNTVRSTKKNIKIICGDCNILFKIVKEY